MVNYYLEYQIINNRPGLLGSVASLLGLLKINILTIASIEGNLRGLLIEIKDNKRKEILFKTLATIEDIKVNTLDKPSFFDFLALKHGKKIANRKTRDTYVFIREDLDLLVDFLGEFLKVNKYPLIGFKGSPRIGKTETAIAAVVHAGKRWQLLSTTLLRKIARTRISKEALNNNTVFIIDAITTFYRSSGEHISFIREIISQQVPRIIEHPEVFIRETDYNRDNFDLVIELFDSENDLDSNTDTYFHSYNSFDIG